MDKFLSCDWGTSSFRLRLVQVPDLTIIAAEHSGNGIASTYQAWKAASLRERAGRWNFYLEVIKPAITAMEQRTGITLEQVPLIISGMASSSIGMMELPYGTLPFTVDGAGVITHWEPATADLKQPVLLISGIRSDHDVMRGEETQLIGCMTDDQELTGEHTFIFPGTHSKHIRVKDRQVVAFQTFMTGEFFELLCKHSILKDSVAGQEEPPTPELNGSFSEGVKAGVTSNLLHAAFRVRTHHLFGSFTKTENLDYLSGLLIGSELKELLAATTGSIYLCGGAHLKKHYETALQVLALGERTTAFSAQWIEAAVIRGQYKIFNHLKT